MTDAALLTASAMADRLGRRRVLLGGLALLAHEFQGRDRGLEFGVWGGTTGAALAVGPLVGGPLGIGVAVAVALLVAGVPVVLLRRRGRAC